MEVKRIIYASERETPGASDLDVLRVLRHVGLEEVILLHPDGFETWEEGIREHGLKATSIGTKGPIEREIDRLLSDRLISMVVLGSGGRHKALPGPSGIRKMMGSSPVPVLVLVQPKTVPGTSEKSLFHHCIFPMDWTVISHHALNYLLEMRGIVQVLEIVTVINKRLSVRDLRVLKEKLNQARQQCLNKGIDAESHVYAGKPWEEILLAVRDYGATAIIMGTSGKSAFKTMVLGSCTYQIVQQGKTPLLVIPYGKERPGV